MVQNKKIGAGLAFAAVLGMCASGSALALPEMDVGSMPPIVAPQSVDTVDSTVAEPVVVDTQEDAA